MPRLPQVHRLVLLCLRPAAQSQRTVVAMFLNYWHEERFHLGRSTHQKYYGEASKPRCDSFGSRHAVQDARQGLVTWYGLHYLVCSCIARFCLMGGGRNAVAFISQILSTIASSKVNYCSSLQLRWKNGCFYAIILLLLLRSMHRGSFLLWLQVTRSMTSIHQIAQRHLQLLQVTCIILHPLCTWLVLIQVVFLICLHMGGCRFG
ncbi:uncharacterized protein LOC122276149 isoform X2 [Carya illinoinensis]|uniref:uncharacterized protein LOC122276149 isoform X2 n=1 Tax=Carya illinoinensis TaxID=32201 RepID=UPI001C726ED5|nr:uncharacterized protein LOC122276149 isoform X2 [Carya illinoinensis]